MPVGDEFPVVEESQLLHDHTGNNGASHTPLCVVESSQSLSLIEKIEKQQAALYHHSEQHAGGGSSSSSAPVLPFGRACSWSSTCAVADDVSDAEDERPLTPPLLHPHRNNNHTTTTATTPTTATAHHYHQSSQPHVFYDDVDVLSCVGSAGSESPYHHNTFTDESSVTSGKGVHRYSRHRRHSTDLSPPTTTALTTITTTTTPYRSSCAPVGVDGGSALAWFQADDTITTQQPPLKKCLANTTSASITTTGNEKDVEKVPKEVKATAGSNDDDEVVAKKKVSGPHVNSGDTLIINSNSTTKPVSDNTSNIAITKRVAVPVKYQGVAVPLVALMPVDPTAKYRKISKSFGTAAATHIDFEALYSDHTAYVAALKLAAPKVRPSPFPFLHEMRMQRKKRNNKTHSPTTTVPHLPSPPSNHHDYLQKQALPPPPPSSSATGDFNTHTHPYNRNQHNQHHQTPRHTHQYYSHQPSPPTTSTTSAYAFYTRDRAPLSPSSPAAGTTPPTYHHHPQHQHQYTLPSYQHAAPTGGSGSGRPPSHLHHHPSTAPSSSSFF